LGNSNFFYIYTYILRKTIKIKEEFKITEKELREKGIVKVSFSSLEAKADRKTIKLLLEKEPTCNKEDALNG